MNLSVSEPSGIHLPPGIDTPALVIDLDVVEGNTRRMADLAAARGVALRPHVKTHKSIALARLQLDAGAVGVTVGTLGEAEVMAGGGIHDVFLAYPIWASAEKAARLRALHERESLRFAVGIDSRAGAERLAAAVKGCRRPLSVLLEVDPGYHRTGVEPGAAGGLAVHARGLGLEVIGAFCHGGHAYREREMVSPAAVDEVQALTAAAASLRAAGFEPQVLSAGSTPTAAGVMSAPVTEVRPGTYLINDRIQAHLGSCAPGDIAVAVAATVISNAVAGKFVIDAGAKSLTKDAPPYLEGHGLVPAYPGAVLERLSDYHGEVRLPRGADAPRLGEVVAVIPNHVCPVVDLFDTFVATRSGRVVGRWPVDARGRSG